MNFSVSMSFPLILYNVFEIVLLSNSSLLSIAEKYSVVGVCYDSFIYSPSMHEKS